MHRKKKRAAANLQNGVNGHSAQGATVVGLKEHKLAEELAILSTKLYQNALVMTLKRCTVSHLSVTPGNNLEYLLDIEFILILLHYFSNKKSVILYRIGWQEIFHSFQQDILSSKR